MQSHAHVNALTEQMTAAASTNVRLQAALARSTAQKTAADKVSRHSKCCNNTSNTKCCLGRCMPEATERCTTSIMTLIMQLCFESYAIIFGMTWLQAGMLYAYNMQSPVDMNKASPGLDADMSHPGTLSCCHMHSTLPIPSIIIFPTCLFWRSSM